VSDYRNILVAYDGSDGARAALRRADELAASNGGAALTLVQATGEGRVRARPSGGRDAGPEAAAPARHSLAEAVSGLDDSLGASPWVVGGPAARAVLAVAEDLEVDLIITGARRRAGSGRAVLGSVSAELVRDARCDVLVVHPEAAQPSA
jgi:nucleotide-binding universal stress UspA family protein